jgi:hypothetical protein
VELWSLLESVLSAGRDVWATCLPREIHANVRGDTNKHLELVRITTIIGGGVCVCSFVTHRCIECRGNLALQIFYKRQCLLFIVNFFNQHFFQAAAKRGFQRIRQNPFRVNDHVSARKCSLTHLHNHRDPSTLRYLPTHTIINTSVVKKKNEQLLGPFSRGGGGSS